MATLALALVATTIVFWSLKHLTEEYWVSGGEYAELLSLMDLGYTFGMLVAMPSAFALLAARAALKTFSSGGLIWSLGTSGAAEAIAASTVRTQSISAALFAFALVIDLLGGVAASWLYSEYQIMWPVDAFSFIVNTLLPFALIPAATAFLTVSLISRYLPDRAISAVE